MMSCQTSSPKKDIWQLIGRVCVCPERGHGYEPERFTELCFSLADFSLKQHHLCAKRSESDPQLTLPRSKGIVLRCNRKVKCKSCQTFLGLFKDDLLSSPTPPTPPVTRWHRTLERGRTLEITFQRNWRKLEINFQLTLLKPLMVEPWS